MKTEESAVAVRYSAENEAGTNTPVKELTPFPDLRVHELLEQTAARTPDAVAVEFEGATLTFAELHLRANQLARVLQRHGVGPDVLVGVCLERSLEMPVALLGIWKAGGAYVPLDASYGAGRIQYVLDEAKVRVLLTHERVRRSLPEVSCEVVDLDPAWTAIAHESGDPVQANGDPSNLAYVIYTSGSTGKPKGVQLEHHSLVNLLCSLLREPGLDADDVMVAVSTISFDIATFDMFGPQLAGARLVVASRETGYDPHLLAALLDSTGATVLQATPATWRLLFESGWRGRRQLRAFAGGEALSAELARKLVARCAAVWNMYGPTETTIYSSIYQVHGHDDRLVPIGKPVANTALYILDSNLQPVAAGSEGELFIGGEGLARGYFEKPQLTREKFLPDPFRTGSRMYRTGDLARFRSDGNVEYLGRLDHQVKIRGYRIELGELEAVLEQNPAIEHAVAAAEEQPSGDKFLVAYFVPRGDEPVSIADLRHHLRKQLPDYMMPSAFVALGELPLTPNGKVDRKALPAPKPADYQSDRDFVAPRDAVEKRIAALWEEVLGVQRVGVKDKFWDLGGRSLLAARLFMKLSRAFHTELPLATLFRAPTVEQLANEVRLKSRSASQQTVVAIQTEGSRAPFFCVHGGGGSTLFLQRLARRLPADQPFYGIEPEGLDGRPFRRFTVEQMASYYLSQIRKVQPDGPYRIGGYCFGGLVAYEMARQLHREGDTAALVALFSVPLRSRTGAWPTRPEQKPDRAPLASRLGGLALRPHRAFLIAWNLIRYRSEPFVLPAFYRILGALHLRVPQMLRTDHVKRVLCAAERKYVPGPYSGSVVLFHGHGDEENAPSGGWDDVAGRVEHRVIGTGLVGSRRDIMNEPLVTLTARELADCLGRASAESGMAATAAPVRRTGTAGLNSPRRGESTRRT